MPNIVADSYGQWNQINQARQDNQRGDFWNTENAANNAVQFRANQDQQGYANAIQGLGVANAIKQAQTQLALQKQNAADQLAMSAAGLNAQQAAQAMQAQLQREGMNQNMMVNRDASQRAWAAMNAEQQRYNQQRAAQAALLGGNYTPTPGYGVGGYGMGGGTGAAPTYSLAQYAAAYPQGGYTNSFRNSLGLSPYAAPQQQIGLGAGRTGFEVSGTPAPAAYSYPVSFTNDYLTGTGLNTVTQQYGYGAPVAVGDSGRGGYGRY